MFPVEASIGIPVVKGMLTGIAAGFASGLLGVSPGGILVPVISLMLGYPQHLAQVVSLAAQVPPTSLVGVRSYASKGETIKLHWVLLLCCGFIVGGPFGAALAKHFTDGQLRHVFVGYLIVLAVLSALKRSRTSEVTPPDSSGQRVNWAALVLIGGIAGLSSGLLGIGGGLAVTALSTLLLRMGQHRAQALSLLMAALPLTASAAWMYVHQGWHLPWTVIVAIVTGLIIGTQLGAVSANHLPERKLRVVFTLLVVGLAMYMAVGR